MKNSVLNPGFREIRWAIVATLLVVHLGPLLLRAEDYPSTLAAEMSTGKTKVFSSATVTNKGSAIFEISYPETWKVKESERPHVLVRIADTNHPQTGSFVIGEIRDSKYMNTSPDKFFTKFFFANFKLTNGVIIHGDRFTKGAFDGGLIEYVMQPGAVPLRFFVSNYMFLQNGSMVQLQFYVSLPEEEDKQADEAKIASYKPLWEAMLATFKLQP